MRLVRPGGEKSVPGTGDSPANAFGSATAPEAPPETPTLHRLPAVLYATIAQATALPQLRAETQSRAKRGPPNRLESTARTEKRDSRQTAPPLPLRFSPVPRTPMTSKSTASHWTRTVENHTPLPLSLQFPPPVTLLQDSSQKSYDYNALRKKIAVGDPTNSHRGVSPGGTGGRVGSLFASDIVSVFYQPNGFIIRCAAHWYQWLTGNV